MAQRQAERPAELALAERYRSSTLSLRSTFVRDYLHLWALLNLDDRSTFDPWLRLAIVLVRQYREHSGLVARAYVRQARELGVGAAPGVEPDLPSIDDGEVIRNLLTTGPGAYSRSRNAGRTPTQARDRAFVASQGAATRLVLAGGRDYVDAAVRADPQAIGFLRVTDGSPCSFCAMLASRGAVYKSKGSAGYVHDPVRGDANRFHDDCGCTVVPVYSRNAALPESSRRFDALWADATQGLSRTEALKAFRRAVEDRVVEGDPLWRGDTAAQPAA